MKRHTCIICKKKRYSHYLENVFGNSWACKHTYYHFAVDSCASHPDILLVKRILSLKSDLKVLTLRNFV